MLNLNIFAELNNLVQLSSNINFYINSLPIENKKNI